MCFVEKYVFIRRYIHLVVYSFVYIQCCVQYYNSFDDENGDERPRCPSCFTDFSVDLTQPALEVEDAIGGGTGANANYAKSSIVNRINMDKWRSSTKIEALVEELSKLRREDKTIKR
jgi:DNA repair protein RAD16